MNFDLSEDQRALQDMARRFAKRELPALAEQVEETARRSLTNGASVTRSSDSSASTRASNTAGSACRFSTRCW